MFVQIPHTQTRVIWLDLRAMTMVDVNDKKAEMAISIAGKTNTLTIERKQFPQAYDTILAYLRNSQYSG